MLSDGGDCFFLQEAGAPTALGSLLNASRITVSSEYFTVSMSGSVLLQSSVCKVNSAGDNTEASGLFCGDRSDSDTVRRVSTESKLLWKKLNPPDQLKVNV